MKSIQSESMRMWRWALLRWAILAATVLPLGAMVVFMYAERLYITGPLVIMLGCAVSFWACAAAFGVYAFWTLRGSTPWDNPSHVRQAGGIVVDGDYAVVFARCERSLVRLGCRFTHLDAGAGLLKATTGRSWRSQREKITIRIEDVATHCHSVHVESDSLLPTAVLDGGANASNVRAIVDWMDDTHECLPQARLV